MSLNIACGDIFRAGIINLLGITAGIIRMQVFFKGGPYMRKHGIPNTLTSPEYQKKTFVIYRIVA